MSLSVRGAIFGSSAGAGLASIAVVVPVIVIPVAVVPCALFPFRWNE